MKSNNITYIPEIDHLRFLAALLVFCFHFFHFYLGGWKPFPQYPQYAMITEGHTGVTLFFVLSGFIFMRISEGAKAIQYSQFLRNRLLRIAPLFVVVFMVAISIGRDRFKGTDLLYIFVTNIGDAPTSWHFVTGAAWSISVEFSFYLIFPFVVASVQNYGFAYLLRCIFMLAIVKLAAFFASDNPTLFYYSTVIGRMDQFFIGMLGAIAFTRWRPSSPRVLLAISAFLILLAVGFQSHFFSFFSVEKKHPAWVVWGAIEAALWAIIVVLYLKAEVRFPRLLDKALRKCGECSFSFYMWHALVIFLFHEALGSIGGTGPAAILLNAGLVFGCALTFAFLSYNTIERPFLELRHRYLLDAKN